LSFLPLPIPIIYSGGKNFKSPTSLLFAWNSLILFAMSAEGHGFGRY